MDEDSFNENIDSVTAEKLFLSEGNRRLLFYMRRICAAI
jgi:hypothetical protein